jgi:hypothetical protein
MIIAAQKIAVDNSTNLSSIKIALNNPKVILNSTVGLSNTGILENRLNQTNNKLNDLINNLNNLISFVRQEKDLSTKDELLLKVFDQSIIDVIKNPSKKKATIEALEKEKALILEGRTSLSDEAVYKILDKELSKLKEEQRLDLNIYLKELESNFNVVKNIKELNIAEYKYNTKENYWYVLDENNVEVRLTLQQINNELLNKTKNPANKKFFEDNQQTFFKLFKNINDINSISKFLNLTLDKIRNAPETVEFDMFVKIVNDRIDSIDNSINFLSTYEPSNIKKINENVLATYYTNIIREVNNQESNIDTTLERTITEIIKGVPPSTLMNNEQYIAAASRRVSKKEIDKSERKKSLGIEIEYDDARKGDDILLARQIPNRVFTREFGRVKKYFVYDEIHNAINTAIFDEDKGTLTLELEYVYRTKDNEYMEKPSTRFITKVFKLEENKLTEKDLDNLLAIQKQFYYDKNSKLENVFGPDYIPKSYLIFDVNDKGEVIDSSKNAIDVLLNHVLKGEGEEYKYENFGYNKDYMYVKNISKLINKQVINKINLLTDKGIKDIDLKEIYNGIYNKITSKYNALERGSLVNQISDKYSYDYNIANIDHMWLADNGISLELNSEASTAVVLKRAPKFPFNFPFGLNTNPVRTELHAKHLMAKYTTIGMLNRLYKQIPDEFAPGKKLMETFLKSNEGGSIRKNFIRKAGNKFTQLFMPNVLSQSMYDNYKNDADLHQFGQTLPVVFINNPIVGLDTLGVDADALKELGYELSAKIWLGTHHGFKGTILPIQDLYKTTGAYFLSNAESVTKRGTAGMYVEMLYNYIRSYLIDETYEDGVTKVVPEKLKQVFDIPEIKEFLDKTFKNNITEDGVLINTFYSVNEELETLSDLLFKYKDQITSLTSFYDANNNARFTKKDIYQWLLIQDMKDNPELDSVAPLRIPVVMSKARLENKPFTYDDIHKAKLDANNLLERTYATINLKTGSFVKGNIFVMADHENNPIAQYTESETKTIGKFVFNILDNNSNVDTGLTIGPAALQLILNVVGLDKFNEVFDFDYTNAINLARPRILGFEQYILDALNTNKENINSKTQESIVKQIETLKDGKELHNLIYTNSLKYIRLVSLLNSTDDLALKKYYQTEIDLLVKNTDANIPDKLYSGKESAFYKAAFKTLSGIRAQFALDRTLDVGEIVIPNNAWNILENRNKERGTIFNTEVLTDKEKINYYIENLLTLKTAEERKDYLNSRGLFEKNNKVLWKAVESGDYLKKINKLVNTDYEFKQTYAYLLSSRSPQQDYGAVPVYKVIGFSKSAATYVNSFGYPMMGADTDGDAFGMAILSLDAIEGKDAPLRKLLATDLNYYTFDEKRIENDKGDVVNLVSYLEKTDEEFVGVNKEGFTDYDITPSKDPIDALVGAIIPTGKKYTIVHNVKYPQRISYNFERNIVGKYAIPKAIRSNQEYLKAERYSFIQEANIINQLTDYIDSNPSVLKSLKAEEENKPNYLETLKTFVNAVIKSENQGENFDTSIDTIEHYKDLSALELFYVQNEKKIDTLYTIERLINDKEVVYGKLASSKIPFFEKTIKDLEEKTVKQVANIELPTVLVDIYSAVLTKDQQAVLKDTEKIGTPEYSKIYKYLVDIVSYYETHITTTERVRAGKTTIPGIGSQRKNQFSSSHLSMYEKINKLKYGYFWEQLGAIKDGEITFNSILSTLLSKANPTVYKAYETEKTGAYNNYISNKKYTYKNKEGETVLKTNIQNLYDTEYSIGVYFKDSQWYTEDNLRKGFKKGLSKDIYEYYESDIDALIKDLILVKDKYVKGIDELKELKQIYTKALTLTETNKSISREEMLKFLRSTSKLDDPVIKEYYKILSNPDWDLPGKKEGLKVLTEKLNLNFVKEIAMRYFVDVDTLEDYLKTTSTTKPELLLKEYFDQQIIERLAQNRMSFLIQKPIDFPKHYGQEVKASVLAKKTLDEGKAIIKKAARRKVIINSNDNDSLFGMGINLDREMNDRIGNTLKRTSKTEINNKWFEENRGRQTLLADVYNRVIGCKERFRHCYKTKSKSLFI